MNVVDSSGWIEYFQDTPRANWFAAAIEDRDRLLVPTISLFEVHRVLSRALPAELVETCLDVMRRGRVLDLTDRRAIAASEAATRHRLALADSAIYSMALEHGATLWTQDVDYEGLPGVSYSPKP
ncbi:type II toxin-antitoxin system VapC family toxin [Polaromonas glacialis]|uniref:type II toxin-antitoxin system VapC family toxin n=1 Tax=Polaromonas glacialis TaxID=866564 RepID=UPI0004959564|nr:type II toxin-antitoxin system VapC family toxin [Polaromonas glacialis]